MSFEELEELIRKYLSTGIAVVVILVAPGTEAAQGGALPSEPSIRVIEPDGAAATGPDSGADDPAPAPDAGDRGPADPEQDSTEDSGDDPERTGAAGRDPERSGQESGDGGSGDSDSENDGSGDSGAGDDSSSDDTPSKDPDSDSDSNSNSNENDTGQQRDTDTNSDSGSRSGGDSGSGGDSDSDSDSGSISADRSGADSSGSGSPGEDASGSGNRSGGSDGGAAAGSGAGAGTTAAQRHGWGTPNREDDFSSGTEQWDIYDGPGHGGNGTRSPSAVSVQDGILTITGDSSGTTAGMAWNPGQKYGRWEGRVRAPAADPSYNALLLLWPDAENFPVGGEIDFMEMMDPSRQQTDIFIHYGEDNSQVNGKVEIDGTQWHNWAVEWTPKGITAYVDGEEWYRTTDTSILPPGPMHLCIQLDWFPEGDTPKESTMQVDWVRQYSLDGEGGSASESSDSGSGSGGDSNNGSDGDTDTGDGTSDRQSDSDSGDNDSGDSENADESDSGEDSPSSDGGQEEGTGSIRELLRRMFSWR
ncbi:glycoside hydrolase family 16 protein [Pseudonocardia xinjiangensis]|uniref:Glycoside hydrolase family 16 protein n=1 Tax=Pseudonocardia xinjiangensis TaxID=75289 RepID=A0ABX1RJ64_9PSEU|nr:glycoside hydrolase family 16 protein [Pseudonocardia xinjiangensis]NMH80442.1 glycoside hydrolase family 16 protein [Pseudonocardia xinjiangensis]